MSGINDPVFHHARFHRCPVSLIRLTIEKIVKRDQKQANDLSYAAAHVAHRVYLFTGGDSKIKQSNFLPYPHLLEAESTGLQGSNKITKATSIAFRQALKDGFIPSSKVGAFFPYLDDVERLTK